MSLLEVATWSLQLLLPLALIGRVVLPRSRPLGSWAVDVALAATCLGAITLAGLWLALPSSTSPVLAVLLVAAAAVGFRRAAAGDVEAPRPTAPRAAGDARPGSEGSHEGRPRAPRTSRTTRLLLLARLLLVAVFVAVALVALAGRRPPEGPLVDLAFPLRQGTYLVATGGSNSLVNPHLQTLAGERYRPYRGQSHAVDLVKVGSWGSRRSGPSPDHPSGFAIFGDSIHAPCSGTVVRSVDGHPDELPEGTTPATLEGNHLILECGGVWVVLAHMVQGSVGVSAGEEVGVGEVVGRVGNSGSSDEPHLHIHAQTPGTLEAPLGGEPIPVTFGGRYLARNQRIEGG